MKSERSPSWQQARYTVVHGNHLTWQLNSLPRKDLQQITNSTAYKLFGAPRRSPACTNYSSALYDIPCSQLGPLHPAGQEQEPVT